MLAMEEEMLNMNCAKALATSVENREGENTVRSEVDDIYTPLEEAKEEIWRRWNDKALRKKVEDFLGGDIPSVFKEAPRAVLSRQILSPNFEMLRFLDLAKESNLKSVLLEYPLDKFVTKNLDKYYLGKIFFYNGVGKNGGRKLSSIKVIDVDKYDGKPFVSIQTLWGGSFINFHKSLVENVIPNMEVFDISHFYRENGGVACKYYLRYISLFVCFGILFENYLFYGAYNELTESVFLPSFRKICETFGLKPLIVQLVPIEKERDVYWRYYPEVMKDKINAILKTELFRSSYGF